MRDVILVHGLWVPAAVMTPLAARLAAHGYRCHLFSYSGRSRPMPAHAERLARHARGIGPAHFIGHSLGGLVAVEALESHRDVDARSVVLLGTPARGSFAARRLAQLSASGADIHSIAWMAACLASAEQRAVNMEHVLRATRWEYQKTQRVLLAREAEGWVP